MYYVIAPTSNDIQHHGVLGQRWGKRNGPPYPLSSGKHSASEKKAGWEKSISKYKKPNTGQKRIIKKGTNFQRIGAANEKEEGVTYTSHKKEDNEIYLLFGLEKMLGGGDTKIELMSIDDISVADANSMINTFIDLYGDYNLSDFVDRSAPIETDENGKITKFSEGVRKVKLDMYRNAFDSEENFQKAYKDFNRKSMTSDNEITKEYIKRIRDLGYDAIPDINDENVAEDPLIILNRSKSLKKIKETPLSSVSQKRRDKLYAKYLL